MFSSLSVPKDPPEISSPISATPWDYAFDDLLVDLKLACKANIYGRISDKTLADIKKALRDGVLVALLVPPRLYSSFTLGHHLGRKLRGIVE
jgi:hypothetical protein